MVTFTFQCLHSIFVLCISALIHSLIIAGALLSKRNNDWRSYWFLLWCYWLLKDSNAPAWFTISCKCCAFQGSAFEACSAACSASCSFVSGQQSYHIADCTMLHRHERSELWPPGVICDQCKGFDHFSWLVTQSRSVTLTLNCIHINIYIIIIRKYKNIN